MGLRGLAARTFATMDGRMAVVAAVLALMFVLVGCKLSQVQLRPDETVVAPKEYTRVVKAYRASRPSIFYMELSVS